MCEYDSKLVKLIVDGTPKALIGLIIVSSIFLWTYWAYIPLECLLLWSLSQLVFIFLRFVNAQKLNRYIEEENREKLNFHTTFLSVILIYSAIIWSFGPLLGAYFAPTPYEFISLAMIMGVVTAAVLTLTPLFNLFLTYFFIMLLVQFGIMIYFGAHTHYAVALFLLIYMPVIVLLSKSLYNNYLHTIESQASLKAHNDDLRELSITDALTKVYNRRYFFDTAQKLVSIAKREKSEISFLMIDIDYFKRVNDTYGHQVGDQVLISLASKIQNMTRESDVFARIGGEEFALLLSNTSYEGAKIIAQKARSAVENMEFENDYIPKNVTISIGVATLKENITTLEELYQEADKKLYIAKELGRNRVQ